MTIELSDFENILAEEYTAEFQRITCIAKVENGPCIKDLEQYNVDITYRLVDCSKDFQRPGVFLEPQPVEEFEDSVVNYMDEGKKYISQFQKDRPKKYKFTLIKPAQKYSDICGPVQYSLTIDKEDKFGKAFVMDDSELTVEPSFVTGN